MLKKILKKDLSRNKLIMAILFVFITLATMLTASAAGILSELSGSVNLLFEKSAAPHYVQMYAGELDQKAIDSFTEQTALVSSQQTVSLLNINGAYLFLGKQEESQANSVLENSFMVQNNAFDYLLDRNNEVLQLAQGEIGVPVYYMKQNHLNAGDRVTVRNGDFSMEFTIRDFVRDVQMNSSLVTSKRFLISQTDMDLLETHLGDREYLIEFRLKNLSDLKEFEALYQASSLPQTGTAITYSLYQLLNSLSDGIVAAVILLVTAMLLAIALVSLRFILLSTIEEDYQEIGNMKAIGISYRQMQSLYLVKYLFVCGIACVCGYLLSLGVRDIFIQNITLYMGRAEQTSFSLLLPLLGACLIFCLIIGSCTVILRRFRKITVTDALNGRTAPIKSSRFPSLRLHRSRFLGVNLFLGWNELLRKPRTYGLLCCVFILCMLLMTVPLNLLNTLRSPSFITYMGAGRSHIRMDISQTESMGTIYASVMETLGQDPDIKNYASFAGGSYKTQNQDGELENIKVENGNYDVFPLRYTSGNAPQNGSQIALSVLNAQELGKKTGSTITVLCGDKKYLLKVSGIYQDITNGGKTAKGMLSCDEEHVMWYVINLDLKDAALTAEKVAAYTARFPEVKITDMKSYVRQTFGSVISSLERVIKLAFILSLAVAALITTLFLRLLTAGEKLQIAGLMSIGFTIRSIRQQYMIRILSVLAAGILMGTALAEPFGSFIAGKLLSGISRLQFVVNPFTAYVLCPLILLVTVSAVVILSTKPVKHINIMTLENER